MLGLYKALYDYAPQDPETELALEEGQVVYVLDKEDAEYVPISYPPFRLAPVRKRSHPPFLLSQASHTFLLESSRDRERLTRMSFAFQSGGGRRG